MVALFGGSFPAALRRVKAGMGKARVEVGAVLDSGATLHALASAGLWRRLVEGGVAEQRVGTGEFRTVDSSLHSADIYFTTITLEVDGTARTMPIMVYVSNALTDDSSILVGLPVLIEFGMAPHLRVTPAPEARGEPKSDLFVKAVSGGDDTSASWVPGDTDLSAVA